MNTDWMKSRQTKYTGFAAGYIVVVIAVLAAANWLANRHNKSLDVTANKRYSLSDQTEKVVKNLKQDVKVTYFDRTENFARGKDLLDRYDNLSTKFSVEYVDPYKKPQVARQAGVKTEGSLFVEIGTRREEAKSVTEEEVTGALIRAMKGGERRVCFVQGSGEHSLDETQGSGYSQAKDLLEKNNYKTQAISLLEKPEVPKECTIVVVGGPRFDYTAPAVQALKTLVEAGGRLLLMLDPPLKLGKGDVSENPELSKLLDGWGVALNKDIVVDMSGVGQLFGLSEVVPLVTGYESHAIVREMRETATAFPLARSLDTKQADKVTTEKLFSTSKNSFASGNLTAAEIKQAANDKKGPLHIGAAGTYNTGKENNNGRFVVVGSSGWIGNNILRFNGNRDLFLNMANWLSADEDLIAIRPKDPEDRRLSLSRAQMLFVRGFSQFLLPLLVIAMGISVWWKRR
ncbi:MAG: hypothetical protein FJW40_20680 [Acidobacteria bacterium]|nr:hypothetical protein [Acidobacteriota bacterium]